MRRIFLIGTILIASNSFGQTLTQQLEKIQTLEHAEQFIADNPNLKANILYIDSNVDSSKEFKVLLNEKAGKVLSTERNIYKVLPKP